jgi:hypothetical protein
MVEQLFRQGVAASPHADAAEVKLEILNRREAPILDFDRQSFGKTSVIRFDLL